jgi:hypothetical protein
MPGGTERGVQCPSPLAKRRRRAELGCELARRQDRLHEAELRLLEPEARVLGRLELRLAETENRILGAGSRRPSEHVARLHLPDIPENLLPNGSLSPHRLLSTETLDRAASLSCSTISGWDIEAAEMAIDYGAEYGALHEYSRVGSHYGLHPAARRREDVVNESGTAEETGAGRGPAVREKQAVGGDDPQNITELNRNRGPLPHDPGPSLLDPGPPLAPLAQFRWWQGVLN